MMKAIIEFFFYVALLPPVIIGNYTNETSILHILNGMAAKGETINGVLKPLKDGIISQNGPIVTYKAFFYPHQIQVTMKLIPENSDSILEYNAYTNLGAIENSDVEAYGISTVYYYDSWNGYAILVTKLLTKNIFTESAKKRIEPLDILIIIREFVQISKYIHSCGVLHNDLKLENFMFDGYKTFITDFSVATRIDQISKSGRMMYKSRRAHGNNTGCARDDWESFLYSICTYIGVKFDWFHAKDEKTIYRLKLNTTNTMKRIEELPSSIQVKNILVELGNELFGEEIDSKNKFPYYNVMARKIEDEIKRLKGNEPYAVYSWLTLQEKKVAKGELAKGNDPEIDHPRYMKDFKYPLPEYFLLRNKYQVTIASKHSKIE